MVAYCEVSAFTDTPGHGNRAGVVLEGSRLSESQMQALAAFIEAPETVFVTRMEQDAIQVRYFTPTQEIDFCGHATVALGLALAQTKHWRGGHLTLETLVGRIPLHLEDEAGIPTRVWMTQRRLESRNIARELRAELAEALGLNERMIHRGLPLGCASTGLWSVFVPLLDVMILDAIEPDLAHIHELSRALDVSSVYAYAPMGVNRFAARDFAPAVGITEDPVTGSAAGALMALLAQAGRLPVYQDRAAGVVYQGHTLGTPGEVDVDIRLAGQTVREIRVGGRAALIFEGHWTPQEV